MNQADLRVLRNPLIATLLVLLISAAAIYYFDLLKKEARQQLTQQQGLLKEARTRMLKSGEEKDIIVKYLESYRQLESAGFIGEEQRINWLDGLRLANRQADLFGVDYQIAIQRPYPYAADFNPGPLALSQSLMQLRFQLLHEEDLMRFLDALARQGGGIFAVDQCVMKRLNTGGVIRFQPNVSAECDLSWITLRLGANAEPKKP